MEDETLARLWEIAQVIAGEAATLTEFGGWASCTCCDSDDGGGWGYDFQHAPECIVLKARALIKEHQSSTLTQERSSETMGGKPNKGTPADKRLKENRPPVPPKPPAMPQKKPTKGK